MMPPVAAAGQFAAACFLGMVLGVFYGFLALPRRKHPHLTDFFFVTALIIGWIYHSFGICLGDIRLGYLAGLLLGIVAGALSLGKVLQPVFGLFWKIVGFPWRLMKKISKKLKKFAKKLLAFGKKWVTIKWNMYRHRKPIAGGNTDDAAGQGI